MAQVDTTKTEKPNFAFEIKCEVSVYCLFCENLGKPSYFLCLTKL